MDTKGPAIVSIVIAAFNAEGYFKECLESVCAQSYPALQIIIIDDGSTDATSEIGASFAARDGRIRFFLQPNRGVSAARNAGIERATGTYLCFFDADDVMYPDSVAKRVAALESTSADVVFGNHLLADADRKPIGVSRGVDLGDSPLERLLESPCMGATDIMFKRESLARVGNFRTDQSHYEDWDLWIRCAAAGLKFVHLDEILDEYRQHASSASRRYDTMLTQGLAMFDRHRELVTSRDLLCGWRSGRYGIMRGWLWSLWDEPRSGFWKVCRIARYSLRYPGLPWTFLRVAYASLAKRICGTCSSATGSVNDIVADTQ